MIFIMLIIIMLIILYKAKSVNNYILMFEKDYPICRIGETAMA